jgi:hypothetical protein
VTEQMLGLATANLVFLGAIIAVIERRTKTLRRNGGTSIADAVYRIDKRVERLEEQHDDHLKHHLDGGR